MTAPFCYIDHTTGESDHMNAHIRTAKCDKPKAMTAPVTRYTKEEMLEAADLLVEDADSGDYGYGGAVQLMHDAAAMLRQAAAEGQGNEACMECGKLTMLPSGACPMPWHPATPTEPTPVVAPRKRRQLWGVADGPTEPTPPPAVTCTWTADDDGIYQTECGHSFYFDGDGGPTEHKQKFCGYCGRHLHEAAK